jgi:type II secretory pathway pseudopilin PulG
MAVIMQTGNNKPGQRGYTFLALLILIMLIGFTLSQAGAMWSDARQRQREQELLKVGDKIRTAIGQYYNNTPGAIKQYPPTLKSLLRDDRFPVPKRYLREIYINPITGRPHWGILHAPTGGVMGVYSLSGQKPFKTGLFRPVDKALENKKMYGDWIFFYTPDNALAP